MRRKTLPVRELVDKAMAASSSRYSVELEFIGDRYERPPLVALLFNATLRNQSDSQRWFLLPATLNSLPGQTGCGVSGLEVFVLYGQARVVLGKFYGSAGFQALLLPPVAEIKIRRFSILSGREAPGPRSIEVAIAAGLMIGGETAESWFDVNPASSARAAVSQDESQMIRSKHTPDLREVPVALVEEQRLQLLVNLVCGEKPAMRGSQ